MKKFSVHSFFGNYYVEILTGLLFVVLAIGILINIHTISPEYDEIWNIREFVSKDFSFIFSNVATPNNHVLNTAIAHGLGLIFGYTSTVLRMVSFAAAVGLFVLISVAAHHGFTSSLARIIFIACTHLNGLLLHYAEKGRGYILQTLCVFGVFWTLYLCRSGKSRAIAWFLFSVAACLTISNGILFVFFLTLLNFVSDGFWKKEKPMIIAGILFAVAAGGWYFGNIEQFLDGHARFGKTFESAEIFGIYCWDVLVQSAILIPFVMTLGACFTLKGEKRKMACAIAGTCILMLASTLVTKGGPVRCYLPLVPLAIFGATLWIDQFFGKFPEKLKMLKVLLTVLCVAIAAYYSGIQRNSFRDPDMVHVFWNQQKYIPQNVAVVYRPTDSMVLLSLLGEMPCRDAQERIAAADSLILLRENLVGTMDFMDRSTRDIPTGIERGPDGLLANNMPFWKYSLRPVAKTDSLKGRAVICMVREMRHSMALPKHFSPVNDFLRRKSAQGGGLPRMILAADGSEVDMEELERLSLPGCMEFYLLER